MAASDRLPASAIHPPDESKLPAGLDLRTYLELKIGIHRYLLNKLDLEKIANTTDDQFRWQVFAVIQEVVAHLKVPFSASEKERIARSILEEVFALGPLEPLLQDPTVS